MRIVVAPDSFKGSISALEAAEAIERGILRFLPDAAVIKAPIADGGEGMVETLIAAVGGQVIKQNVTGPLGTPVEAHWGILADGEAAVIEMAAASGLTLVPKDQRDPRLTTTAGTGELVVAALDQGLRKIILGIGGSATNDGGAGFAQALGVRFLDQDKKELPPGGAALANLASIDITGLDPRLSDTTLLVACDVGNPLCGASGATAIYGPQKGATAAMIAELDAALAHYAEIAKRITNHDIAQLPGAGAAGGLGAALLFFTPAILRPGVDLVLEMMGFKALLATADFVITGEGRTDFQTTFGKAPIGVARIAKELSKPVVCLSGGLGDGADDVLNQGVDAVASIAPGPIQLDDCLVNAAQLLESAAERVCRLINIGRQLK